MTGSADIRKLYLFGAGGHGREVAWLAHDVHPQAELEYLVDEHYVGDPINGIPVRAITELRATPDSRFVVAVGDSRVRERVASALTTIGVRPIALVHPRVERAPNVQIGEGSVVCAGSVLTDGVRIGAHSVVNVGCTLSHDVSIADFVTLSPGVHIAGNVIVADGAFIGIGASVVNGTSAKPLVIGANAVVAAGATVVADVESGAVVGGVPARPLRTAGRR